MSTLFISDLHLEDARPEPSAWMKAFLEGPAQSADAVYILGDLFEYWIGDDALSATARELAGATRRLASRGLPIHFIHGNRDFLLGSHYADLAGFSLLPETVVIDLYGEPTLLMHGDTLCTATPNGRQPCSHFPWKSAWKWPKAHGMPVPPI